MHHSTYALLIRTLALTAVVLGATWLIHEITRRPHGPMIELRETHMTVTRTSNAPSRSAAHWASNNYACSVACISEHRFAVCTRGSGTSPSVAVAQVLNTCGGGTRCDGRTDP